MKRIIIPAGIVLTTAAVAAFFLVHRTAPYRSRAAELAPSEALLFVQTADLKATAERWKKTALFALWQEPEMQAFLERSRSRFAATSGVQAHLERLERLKPREAFLAVTSLDGPTPKFVAGFSFDGNRGAAEAVLAEPRAVLKRARPAGKADLISYRGTEIETFTDKDFTFAETYRDRWHFVANDLELLQGTLDRYDRTTEASVNALDRAEIFKKVTAHLPAERDLFFVVQPGPLTDRLAALMAAAGQANASANLAELRQTQAIAGATKLDGLSIRDTVFFLGEGSKPEALKRNSLALTSPGTLLHYVTTLPATIELPESTTAMVSLLVPAFGQIQKALTDKGLSPADFTKAFGPELGAIVEWPQNSPQPGLVVAFDVRDPIRAKAVVDVLVGGSAGSTPWVQREHSGAVAYSVPTAGLSLVAPTIMLNDRFLLFGLTAEAVSSAHDRLNSGTARLDSVAGYLTAAKSVAPPTNAYGWFDLGGLFQRAYGTFRPFLVMSVAFMPDVGQYLDVGKLPATETITRHLSPTVFTQSSTGEGTLIESTGTLTVNQAALGVIAGSISAALPALRNLPAGQSLDPSKFLPVPPVGPPPAPPSPVPPEPPDER